MGRRRRGHNTHDTLEQEPYTQSAFGAVWAYLSAEGAGAGDRLERRCNEVGARGWELVNIIPLSQLDSSSGGRAAGAQLFFKRRLP